MRIENLQRVEAFITKDGSEIRELAGVPTGNSRNQSLAEATVPPGGRDRGAFHRASEEIYFFTQGTAGCTSATRRARWRPATRL